MIYFFKNILASSLTEKTHDLHMVQSHVKMDLGQVEIVSTNIFKMTYPYFQ